MKYSEISNENFRKSVVQYIDECWAGHRESALSTLRRITNYLFVLNSGGLIASLTYVAATTCTKGMSISIWLFSIGVLSISLHAALDYYLCEHFFRSFREDINQFYKDELDWEVMTDRNSQRGNSDWYLHVLGWLSGILFFAGLFNGICQVS
jgi:hypothetical protein